MSRNVTLSQLRTDVAAQCDFSTSTTGRYTPTLLNRIINQSIQRFRERISNEGMTHFLVSYSAALSAGPTSTFSFHTLDLSLLSPALVRTYGVDISIGGIVRTLAHRPFTERNDFSLGPTRNGTPVAWAHFQTTSIAIMPAPDNDYPYTVWYLPVLADLSADGDTFDGVAGWEVWVMWDCVCQLIARDQYATAYTQAIAERDLAWQDIIRSSTKVSAAGGAFVGRDSMGAAGLFGARPRSRDLGVAGAAAVTANTIFGAPDEVGEDISATADTTTPIGFSWQKRRFWITPDIDLTGSVDATAAIQAALSVRDGACVYLPDGVIRIVGALTPTKAGVTLTGCERGMRRGHRVDVPVTTTGTLIKAYGTSSPLFSSADECSFRNLEVYYPDQDPDGVTPTTYQATFSITSFGCTIENITAINPHTLISVAVAGCKIDTVYSFPLYRGIVLGVCNDVVRVSNVHLNPNLSDANATYRAIGPNLKTYVAANGIAYLSDGAEGFEFSNCFAFGYQRGFHLGAGSGYFMGGGFDQSGNALFLAGAASVGASTLSGIVCVGTGFVAVAGGNCINFADSHVAASASERPSAVILGGVFDAGGAGAGRGIVLSGPSYGICRVTEATFQHMANECGRNDSSNAYLVGRGCMSTPTCAARFAGSSANIWDLDGITLP